MLKILQVRLQQYVNWELPDIQTGLRKGRGTRDQITNFCWIIKKAGEFQRNIYFCFIDCAKAFDCVNHNKLWKTLKEMGIPDHLTCLLRNMYVSQEATVRTLCGRLTVSKLRKEYDKAIYCHPIYLTYMQSTSWETVRLDEAQAGIKIAGRNINNLRYANDATLKAESKKELKSLLMRVKKEGEKANLKLNIK